MDIKKTGMGWVLLIAALAMSCQDLYHHNSISTSDKETFDDMRVAYRQARVYQDSLVDCADSNCSQAHIAYCDSMFHHHESRWAQHHDDYSHDNAHDDHRHDGQGMHHNNNTHHNAHDNEHHHQYHHDQMRQLKDDHQPYHP